MSDPFNLARFKAAQQDLYAQALGELRAGAKRSHWMWFIFPQITGLGQSETARFYAIRSLAEARAYLAHSVLGTRLPECTEAVLTHPEKTAPQILGSIDAVKLKSSMTLFAAAAAESALQPLFLRCLKIFFDGEQDGATLRILANG